MDDLLSIFKQVYVVMPAKAAGTSFKAFTKKCMNGTYSFHKVDNILGDLEKMRDAFQGSLEMPTLISSHLTNTRDFVSLLKWTNRHSLVIYIHREETDRLRSSIVEVATKLCTTENKKGEGRCVMDEDMLVEIIVMQKHEIGFSESRLLTCNTYDSIEENLPNLVFMNYKQANKMQNLLAKHHCPGTESMRQNAGMEKRPIAVKLKNSGGGTSNSTRVVGINDWLDAKMQLMEYIFRLKLGGSCQAKSKKIEKFLFSCPDKTMLVSSY